MHRFEADSALPLRLGGIEISEAPRLLGHSDGDALIHAVIDAILGAAGLGDIGQVFPDTGEELDGADSIEMLREVSTMINEAGWAVANADCTVITDTPQIAPVKDQMEQNLSDAAGGSVTVCGKRTEGIGALGRGEGVVAIAVALLEKK